MTKRASSQIHTSVPSPCISLCKMNQDTGLCEGCWRTLDEVVIWGIASDTIKREIWQKIYQRKSDADNDTLNKSTT